jgi:serine/threonine protein kinase
VESPRHRWLSQVGEGASGEVWAASRDGVVVAVKVVRGALEGSVVLDALRREVAVARKLADLPGVVVARDATAERGVVQLEMELVQGPDLARVLEGWLAARRQPLPTSLAVPWMVGVLRTLDAAGRLVSPDHPDSFVHRDVKPANLLLDPTGRLRLTDFGVARARDLADVQTTTTGVIKGTPRFMAPEVVTGQPVSASADQYSAAAVLFELVTGLRLVEGPSIGVVLAAVARGDVAARLEAVHDVALAAVLRQMLARDPAARFADHAAAADALSGLSLSGPSLDALLPLLLSFARSEVVGRSAAPEADAETDVWGGAELTWEATADVAVERPPPPPPPSRVGWIVGAGVLGVVALAALVAAAIAWA